MRKEKTLFRCPAIRCKLSRTASRTHMRAHYLPQQPIRCSHEPFLCNRELYVSIRPTRPLNNKCFITCLTYSSHKKEEKTMGPTSWALPCLIVNRVSEGGNSAPPQLIDGCDKLTRVQRHYRNAIIEFSFRIKYTITVQMQSSDFHLI